MTNAKTILIPHFFFFYLIVNIDRDNGVRG